MGPVACSQWPSLLDLTWVQHTAPCSMYPMIHWLSRPLHGSPHQLPSYHSVEQDTAVFHSPQTPMSLEYHLYTFGSLELNRKASCMLGFSCRGIDGALLTSVSLHLLKKTGAQLGLSLLLDGPPFWQWICSLVTGYGAQVYEWKMVNTECICTRQRHPEAEHELWSHTAWV